MSTADLILVRILAEADAVRLPCRDWNSCLPANRVAGLASLAGSGLPFRMNASDESDRKGGEQALVGLAAAKLITLARHGAKKFPQVRLTSTGDARARALAGLPSRADGRKLLAAVGEQSDREPVTLDRRWVSEIALNNGEGWGFDATADERRGLGRIEMQFLPASVQGWLIAGTSVQGHAYFAVTAAGWSELDSPSKAPNVAKSIGYAAAADGHYGVSLTAALAALASSKTAWPGEIGECPLPVALRGVKIYPAEDYQ